MPLGCSSQNNIEQDIKQPQGIMNKQYILDFLKRQNHLALKIGFAVAIIHFFIMFKSPDLHSFWTPVWLIFMTPSYMLHDNNRFPLIYDFLNRMNSDFLFTIISSLVYGVIGGFLTSKKKYLQLISVIALCVLVLFGLNICFWAYLVQGWNNLCQ